MLLNVCGNFLWRFVPWEVLQDDLCNAGWWAMDHMNGVIGVAFF